jgi:hypothetical protein
MRYVAAVDPSGGGADAFTLAIVHDESPTRIVQDVMRGWASSRTGAIDLAAIVAESARIVNARGLYRVVGDRYAGKWVAQEYQKVGIYYDPVEIDKSRAYQNLEPWLAQGRLELLDHPTMLRELRLLEKRHRAGGKPPLIDHPRGGHDDHANALALAVWELTRSMSPAVAVMFDPAEARRAPVASVDAAGGGHGFGGHIGENIAAAIERRHASSSIGGFGRPRRGGFWR